MLTDPHALAEQSAPDTMIPTYPGVRKLANVVNEFWGALMIEDARGDTQDTVEARITQEFARALFAAVFRDESVIDAILDPTFVQRDGTG